MDAWTKEDEKQLQELQRRRKQTLERQTKQLLAVLRRHLPPGTSEIGLFNLQTVMIANGGEFRDALLPFDHMGRPEKKEETDE